MAARIPWSGAFLLLLALLGLISSTSAQAVEEFGEEFVQGVDDDGDTVLLRADRNPALYTGDYGDCLGGESLFNVTKFDAAMYTDNFTVIFHLHGTTNLREEHVMLHISVDAYGENRFEMTFDPCLTQVYSMCPIMANQSIEAWAIIPIGPSDLESIPSIAKTIPDIEGTARMSIFSNSSQTQIGCFQAPIQNGNSFAHAEVLSPFLAMFAVIAMISSFAVAIYGYSVPHMRTHYAHAFSALIVFETYQSIFFSGALSVPWPSVLPAWWSNFAWSAGLIGVDSIIDSISPFAGVNGNASQVGGAGSVTISTGGGLAQQIYGRDLLDGVATGLGKRQNSGSDDKSDNPFDYSWGGGPATPGLPTPGTWSGFPGTLSVVGVPVADAFTLALVWLAIVIAFLALVLVVAKFTMDFLARTRWEKRGHGDRFKHFRDHPWAYMTMMVLRTLLIGFFSMTTLALLQFNLGGAPGPMALAGVVFLVLTVGMGCLVAYACWFRLRFGRYEMGPDTLRLERGKLFRVLPFVSTVRASQLGEKEQSRAPLGQLGWFRVRYVDDDPQRKTVHEDEPYVCRFGWLSAHYRRRRWWFFAAWLGYQLVRACFLGGAVKNPLVQVFGNFLVECLAFLAIVKLQPFEGQRNMVMAVWLLSISKVVTAGLSIGFLPDFGLSRIVYTVLGIVIIIVQGFVVVALAVLVVLGAFSSWMSLSRNRESFPDTLEPWRVKYFERMDRRAPDVPPPPKPDKREVARQKKLEKEAALLRPRASTFSVRNVKRMTKIEDELPEHDADYDVGDQAEGLDSLVALSARNSSGNLLALSSRNNSGNLLAAATATSSPVGPGPAPGRTRTDSMSSRHSVSSLPRQAARPHRASWSAKDFAAWDAQQHEAERRPDSPLAQAARREGMRRVAHARSQGSLRRASLSRSGTPTLVEPRTNSSMALRKPPMTPALEMAEDQVIPLMPDDAGAGGAAVAATTNTPDQATTSPSEKSTGSEDGARGLGLGVSEGSEARSSVVPSPSPVSDGGSFATPDETKPRPARKSDEDKKKTAEGESLASKKAPAMAEK